MSALLREAPAGQLSRLLFSSRIYAYDDEKPGFTLPSASLSPEQQSSASSASTENNEKDPSVAEAAASAENNEKDPSVTEAATSSTQLPVKADNTVDWYGPQDLDNPQNWSTAKKTFVFFQICLLTFASKFLI